MIRLSTAALVAASVGRMRHTTRDKRTVGERRVRGTSGLCDDRAVAAERWYRKDLFTGTAEYYDRFRTPYPLALVDDLRVRVSIVGISSLLDVACGTGQVAFALAADVAEVWAVDQEPEFIEFGERKARRLGVGNIRWVGGTAEEVPLDGVFDLVTIGNAFHRLERDAVATRLRFHLVDNGCVALLCGDSPWSGDRPWQQVLHETLVRWRDVLDVGDRVPEDWDEVIERDPHEQVLRRAGLVYEGRFEFPSVQRWTVDSLIGFVYSTSFLNQTVLAHNGDAFENDLRQQLLACRSDDVFEQHATFAYDLARRADHDRAEQRATASGIASDEGWL